MCAKLWTPGGPGPLGRSLRLPPGFHGLLPAGVAVDAERLPVRPSPKEHAIATMGDDVVHDLGRLATALPLQVGHGARRMR